MDCLFRHVEDEMGFMSSIFCCRWFGQHRDPAGMMISWVTKILCRTSTGTTTNLGPGLLQMQQYECPLNVLGKGRVTEGGLKAAGTDDDEVVILDEGTFSL